jgi:hypothetical protein
VWYVRGGEYLVVRMVKLACVLTDDDLSLDGSAALTCSRITSKNLILSA